MDHESLRQKLIMSEEPEITPDERSEILQHLERCQECRQLSAAWTHIQNRLAEPPSLPASESFIYSVMSKIEELEAPREKASAAAPSWIPGWIFPALGYAFAFVLMFAAISHRQPTVNTGAILMADMPQATHWSEEPDMTQLLGR